MQGMRKYRKCGDVKSTDEDARQAMLLDGGKLKEIQIKLLLSSRTEMLRVIEQARQQAMKLQNLMSVPPQPLVPQVTLQNAAVVDQNKPEEDDDFNGRKESSRRDRSSSRERRGRSRDKSRSRDRSRDRGRHSRDRDRRRRDRSRDRSRDRYRRRRSRSYDRKRNSRDDKDRYGRDRDRTGKIRDSDNESKDGKGTAETKAVLPESKAASDIQNSAQNVVLQSTEVVTAQPASSPVQVKIPDPPAIPQMLLQFQQNGKEASTAAQQPQAAKQEIPSQAGAAFAFPPSAYTTSAVAPQQAMPPMNQEQWAQMAGMQMPMMNSNVVMPPRGPMMTPEMAMNFPGGFPMAQPGMAAFQPGMYPPNFPPMTPDMWRMATPMTMDPMQQVAQQQVPTELCVEIRGLPSNASYVDIKKLFNECSISSDGIKMINDTQGYRTGIAYVKFSSPEHLQIALNQDGQKVRNTSVEVLTLRSSIFDSAIDNFKPEKDKSRVDARNLKKDVDTRQARVSPVQSPREIVDPRLQRNSSQPAYSTDTAKNKPLPASVTLKTKMISIKGATNTSDRDVHDFFSEVGISPSNINFVPDSTGTQILCLFETEEEADKAITKSNSYLGRSLVMVEKVPEQGPNDSYQNRKRGSSRERDRDRRDGKDESRLSRRGRDRPSRFDKPRDELRDEMPSARVSPPLRDPRRPPLLVNPGQGQDMQGGGPMMGMNEPRMPNDGMMDHPMIDRHPSMMDRQGPPMGRMMMDPMCNDGPFMERPPNRFQIDRRPGMDGPRMNGPPGMDGPRMNGPPGMDGPRMNGPPGMDGPRMNGPPMMGCPPMMDGPMRGGRFPNGPRGPMGDGPFNNRFNNQQNDDGWRDGPMRRGPMNDRRDPRGDRMDRRDDRRRNFDERPSRFNNDPRNGPRSRMMDNADQRSNRPGSPFIDNESVDNFGQPGCVIALENVNFRADIDDILSFFNGFDINNEDVIRRFDEKGRPTGDARVAFKTPMEANRAVEMLNHNNMLGRPVNMYVL